MDIILKAYGGIGNSLLLIPLMKNLIIQGHFVYLDASESNHPEVVELFQNWALQETALLTKRPLDALVVTPPYFRSIVSPFTGESLSWRTAYSMGEANLYLSMLNRPNFSVLQETTPLWNEFELASFSSFKNFIALGFETNEMFALRGFARCGEIADLIGDNVVWLGAGQNISRIAKRGGVDMCGKLTLSQTASLMKNCAAFIGTDSGLAHLSAAIGVPTFILFGPTSEIKNAPHGPLVFILTKETRCRPCQSIQVSLSECKEGFMRPPCMAFEPLEIMKVVMSRIR